MAYTKILETSLYDLLDQQTPDEVIITLQKLKSEYAGRKITFNVVPQGDWNCMFLEVYEEIE